VGAGVAVGVVAAHFSLLVSLFFWGWVWSPCVG
jgi:hypothetical protein